MGSHLKKSGSLEPGPAAPSEAGTGVFLPKSQASDDTAIEPMATEMPCSESDGDSNISASECIVLEERQIRRGTLFCAFFRDL